MWRPLLVREPGTAAELQRRQGHIGRGRRHLPGAVAAGAEAELVQVYAFSPHRDLDRAVRLAQGAGVQHQQPAPHHRADPKQPDFNLDDANRAGNGRCGVGVSAGFRLLRRSGHQPNIPRPALRRRRHHTLPHGSRAGRCGATDAAPHHAGAAGCCAGAGGSGQDGGGWAADRVRRGPDHERPGERQGPSMGR